MSSLFAVSARYATIVQFVAQPIRWLATSRWRVKTSPGSVLRLAEENKRLTKRNRVLAEIAARTEAGELIRASAGRIITHIFDDRVFEEVKLTGTCARGKRRCDRAAGELANARSRELIFARAADVSLDMSRLLRDVCKGRGGGTPDFAQGGCSSGALDAMMEEGGKKAQEMC